MKIERFNESNKLGSGDFDYEWGGCCFVLARPKVGWNNFVGAFGISWKNEDFVPCMVNGWLLDKWGHLNLYIPGRNPSYDINDFEVLEGSDKAIKELIDMMVSAKKYNL